MTKITIPIKGLHCRSCETLVKEKLEEVAGVKRAEVSVKKAEAHIELDRTVEQESLEQAIKDAGYRVGQESKNWLSADWRDWRDFSIAAVALIIVIALFKIFGFKVDLSSANNPDSLLVVAFVGLVAGFSTCMALTGGLILSISARHNQKHPEASSWQKFTPYLYFNAGRLASYFFLGGIIGLVGSFFKISPVLWAILTIIVGIIMLTLGAQLINIFPRLSAFSWSGPSKFFGLKKKESKEYSHSGSLVIGALTFFLPCGFTQAMQLYAMTTGSFWSGAMVMLVFALGTMVGLLTVGVVTSLIKGKAARTFFKFIGLVLIVLAFVNISNGWTLLGLKGRLTSSTGNNTDTTQNVSAQVIKADYTLSGDIVPNEFVVKAGQPIRLEVKALENGQGCMSTIMIPGLYNTPQPLRQGNTVVMEFTPKSRGTYPITCAMGVKRGQLIVQ